ncbi:hypothetical protein Rsub_05564 [Raphidocelis subcapitata]|uniref:Domain of unknown function at the cortex 1 domain-containing protein n=1 Tax=Raphidocelis subcapitata TaxID=307507 RepID=A0A2V0P0B6_9CHLO|nr:hypothetical protein Rsub_05564 [Raphidocelis subcapitata]|eukprot:GBF92362.1 hypothetical protein Rsub_05564 [Raphidocelis subcapitata]
METIVSAEIRPRVSATGPKKVADAAAEGSGAAPAGISTRGLNPLLLGVIPSREAFQESSHYPILVTNSPFIEGKQVIDGNSSYTENIEGINTRVMDFESEVTYGKLRIDIRSVKSTRPGFFDGKKRFVEVAVQAQFKRECKTDSLCIGQELQNDVALPVWMRQVLLNTAAKAFSSTTRVEVEGTPRYFMNPVLAACQLINVSRPGEEPTLEDAKEDVRLMLPKAVDSHGNPLPSEKRRKWCDVPANVCSASYKPGLVYTFKFWQHYADFGDYRLSVGWLNLDLSVFMNRFPMQLTVKDVDSNTYAFSVLVWHERLVYGAGAKGLEAGAAAAQLGGGSGGGGGGPGVGSRLFAGMGRMLGGGK